MRTSATARRGRVLGVLALLASAAPGCVGTSIAADMDRVRELTRASLPHVAASARVEADTAQEARAVLRRPLTPESAVRLALANNRALRASLRELGVPRGRLIQAGLLPNPTVEFDLRQSTDPGQPVQADFMVEFDLTDAVLAPVRAHAAHADLEAARYRVAGEVVELGYAVRSAVYAAQAAEQRLAIAQRALDAFAASRDAARALFDAGNVAELDAATQDAAYEGARVAVAQLELELSERRERLARLLGLAGRDAAFTVAPDAAAQDALAPAIDLPQDLERRAVTASLELAETRRRLEAIARRTGLTRAQGWLPDISVDVHAEQDGPFWEIGAGARVRLPVFDRRQGTLAAHEAEFDGLMERYHGAAIDVRSAARAARNRVVSAHARARHVQQVVLPARARVMAQTQLQYNAMQVGVFQLLEARRAQLDAELALVDTLREYRDARAALDALLAGRRVNAPLAGPTASLSASTNPEGGH